MKRILSLICIMVLGIMSVNAQETVPYYLVGNMTEWGPKAAYRLARNTAAEVEEYMISVDLKTGDEFKIAKSDNGTTIADTDWYPTGMGNNYAISKDGNYTVYFRPDGQGNDDWWEGFFYVQENVPAGDPVYTVVGELYYGDDGKALGFFGESWTVLEANAMTKGEDGIYTLTLTDKELPVGTLVYKVVKNDWEQDWGFPDNPNSGNAEYNVTEAGTYDVTLYFNPDDKLQNNYHVDCVMTKKGGSTIEPVYTVVGELYYGSDGKELGFFGKSWTILEANALTKGEDGIYTLTLTDKELPIGTLSYKVVKNDWEQDWGFPDNPNSGNAEYNVTEAGTYDVTFYFNPDALLQNNYHVSCVMTKHTEPAPDPVYTVVGEYYYGEGTRFDFFGEADWTIYEANAMTKGEDGIWTLKMEKELPAGTLNYKVVKGDWEQDWGFPGNGEYGNADYNVLEAGKYDITFYFNPTELLLNNYHVDCNMTVSAGISGITIDKQQTGAVYNLNGQRVAADYKGLVIVNGRKIVIR